MTSLLKKLFKLTEPETAAGYDFGALSSSFLNHFAETLRAEGFSRRGRSQTFRRKTPCGFHCIHLGLARQERCFLILPSLAIRFDEVEALVNLYAINRESIDKEASVSLSQTLGQLSGEPTQWAIRKEPDIETAVSQIFERVRDANYAFFSRFEDLGEFASALIKNRGTSLVPTIADRAMYAVVLAHLTHGPSLAAQTISHWEDYFRKNPIPEKRFFEGFVQNFLRAPG